MRCFLYSCCLLPLGPPASALELAGLSVTPHVRSAELRYRRPPEPGLGARVELFLRHDGPAPLAVGAGHPVSFDQRTPAELLTRGDWAWHDTPAARPTESVVVPPGALMVWSFNSRSSAWGAGTRHEMALGTGAEARPIAL
ncbi:MAG: hypothetical protein FJ399_21415, partial [Verrucomicrobia bacterium]|nr:hypothetical protein [Verrucomicrobiota bacterium]